jgi:hypothetical protein
MGLVRRLSVFDRRALDAQLFGVLKRERDHGRGLLYTYFKRQGQLVSRYGFIFYYFLY